MAAGAAPAPAISKRTGHISQTTYNTHVSCEHSSNLFPLYSVIPLVENALLVYSEDSHINAMVVLVPDPKRPGAVGTKGIAEGVRRKSQ